MKKIKLPSISKVIRVLVVSDFFLLFGWGLVVPILAIFIAQRITFGDMGEAAKVVGIAVGIYWIGQALMQLPVANFLDKHEGDKDDYYSLIGGTFLASLTPLGFIFASSPWHIYALQAVHALGMAFAVPSWSAIFTRHIGRGKEAFSWSLENSSASFATGIAGIIGGVVASSFGFVPVFVAVSVLGIIAAILFLLIKENLIPKEKVYPMPKIR